jgi:hypothetical protein
MRSLTDSALGSDANRTVTGKPLISGSQIKAGAGVRGLSAKAQRVVSVSTARLLQADRASRQNRVKVAERFTMVA